MISFGMLLQVSKYSFYSKKFFSIKIASKLFEWLAHSCREYKPDQRQRNQICPITINANDVLNQLRSKSKNMQLVQARENEPVPSGGKSHYFVGPVPDWLSSSL